MLPSSLNFISWLFTVNKVATIRLKIWLWVIENKTLIVRNPTQNGRENLLLSVETRRKIRKYIFYGTLAPPAFENSLFTGLLDANTQKIKINLKKNCVKIKKKNFDKFSEKTRSNNALFSGKFMENFPLYHFFFIIPHGRVMNGRWKRKLFWTFLWNEKKNCTIFGIRIFFPFTEMQQHKENFLLFRAINYWNIANNTSSSLKKKKRSIFLQFIIILNQNGGKCIRSAFAKRSGEIFLFWMGKEAVDVDLRPFSWKFHAGFGKEVEF